MKRLILIFLFTFVLISCTNQNDRIPYPENIRLSNETVLWDEVLGATSYSIKINGTVYPISDTSFSLEDFPDGTYDIRIRSHKEDVLSYFSPLFKVVLNRSNPRISSADSVDYIGEDLVFTFELNGGIFVGLSGNTITLDDYQFNDQTLTISSSFIERLLLDNPLRQTIILVYQLSKNSNITMGFIFINIPQD